VKKRIRQLLGPRFISWFKRVLGISTPGLRLRGPFLSWNQAVDNSSGYDAGSILRKVLATALKAKENDHLFERDSVLVGSQDRSRSLSAGLMWSAAMHGGELRVLDFGGSLASTYFHNQDLIQDLTQSWSVVEQEHFVTAGREHFQTEELVFFDNIGETLNLCPPNVILLSSALQYLENPYEVLGELLAAGAGILIVDRTPFYEGTEDLLMVQDVPKSIYEASYPMWVFSKERFLETVSAEFELISTFAGPEGTLFMGTRELVFPGFLFKRRKV